MYADRITDSMRKTMDETTRRRAKQMAYNEKHDITPTAINKAIDNSLKYVKGDRYKTKDEEEMALGVAADPIVQYMTAEQLEKAASRTKRQMEKAAKELDFMLAAQLRDEYFALKEKIAEKKK
jgi:excinuclease ABC subunit B